MKKILLFISILISCMSAAAQSYLSGPDVGGLWCIVDVDLKHDIQDTGYGYYVIDTPLAGAEINLSGSREILCMGPGRPRLVEKDGKTTLKLWLNDVEIELMDDDHGILYVEVNTDTMVDVMTWYDRPSDSFIASIPKYYTIQLNVKNTNW